MRHIHQHVYSFSVEDFVPKILSGAKPHTIRPRRRRTPVKDDLITLYYKQRTKGNRVIALARCKAVKPVVMYPCEKMVKVNGHLLGECETATLARKDGFIDYLDFFAFFQRYYKTPSLLLELVEWDPDFMLPLWEMDQFQALAREMNARQRMEWLESSVEIGKALKHANMPFEQAAGMIPDWFVAKMALMGGSDGAK